jgi:predicted MFS family arabinose efflux permease
VGAANVAWNAGWAAGALAGGLVLPVVGGPLFAVAGVVCGVGTWAVVGRRREAAAGEIAVEAPARR